jgi:hypothetical protein
LTQIILFDNMLIGRNFNLFLYFVSILMEVQMNKFYACSIILLVVITGALQGAAEHTNELFAFKENSPKMIKNLALLCDQAQYALCQGTKMGARKRPYVPGLDLSKVNQGQKRAITAPNDQVGIAPLTENNLKQHESFMAQEASAASEQQVALPKETVTEDQSIADEKLWRWPVSTADKRMALGHLPVFRTKHRESPRARAITNFLKAVYENDVDGVEAGLRMGLVNCQYSKNGATGLLYAVQQNHDNMVKKLLAHGADPRIADNKDVTPRAYAFANAQYDFVLQLDEALKKYN